MPPQFAQDIHLVQNCKSRHDHDVRFRDDLHRTVDYTHPSGADAVVVVVAAAAAAAADLCCWDHPQHLQRDCETSYSIPRKVCLVSYFLPIPGTGNDVCLVLCCEQRPNKLVTPLV